MSGIERAGLSGREAIGPIEDAGRPAGASSPTGSAEGPKFADALAGAIGEASKLERASQEQSARFAAGDPKVGVHEVIIGAEKASIAVRYAVTLKNKVIEAYRELMNTQL